jgi:hypothetical protein
MDITAHLKRSRHGVFYCRFRLRSSRSTPPGDVQISEIAHSLATTNRRNALALSYPINAAVLATVNRARACGASHTTTLMDLRNQLHHWTAAVDLRTRALTVTADPRIPGDSRAATLAVAELMRLLGSDRVVDPPPIAAALTAVHTVHEAIERYLETDAREHAPATVKEYRSSFTEFEAWLQAQSVTTKTVNKKLSAAKMVLHAAEQRGMLVGAEPLFRGLHFSKKQEQRETR